jgi:hypothetical protein
MHPTPPSLTGAGHVAGSEEEDMEAVRRQLMLRAFMAQVDGEKPLPSSVGAYTLQLLTQLGDFVMNAIAWQYVAHTQLREAKNMTHLEVCSYVNTRYTKKKKKKCGHVMSCHSQVYCCMHVLVGDRRYATRLRQFCAPRTKCKFTGSTCYLIDLIQA